ncbi:hypothetical protein DPMN_014518, partial [Dreissena polymorpha]
GITCHVVPATCMSPSIDRTFYPCTRTPSGFGIRRKTYTALLYEIDMYPGPENLNCLAIVDNF